MENKKNSRIGGERGRVKTDFDMSHLIPRMENKTAEERLIDQIELNKTLKIKALSDRDGDKSNMYQYAVQELQSVYHHILQPLSQQLAEKDKEIKRYKKSISDFALAISKLNNAKSYHALENIVLVFFDKIDKILSK